MFLHELEDIIAEWIALVYHRSRQDGLAVPEWPHLKLSPNEMYETGVARAGLLRIPATPELAYEFLEVHPRTIQHYGVEVGGRDHQIGGAPLLGECLEGGPCRAGLLRDQHEPLALAWIGNGRDGRERIGPEL